MQREVVWTERPVVHRVVRGRAITTVAFLLVLLLQLGSGHFSCIYYGRLPRSIALMLARPLRCSIAKLTCHKNWNCYQLVRAFDVEDYCIKLGWCNGKCSALLPFRLPRPLHQAATYYMTARCELHFLANPRPALQHYVSCGLKSTKCWQALHLVQPAPCFPDPYICYICIHIYYIPVKGLIDSVHSIEQPRTACLGIKIMPKFAYRIFHCTAVCRVPCARCNANCN